MFRIMFIHKKILISFFLIFSFTGLQAQFRDMQVMPAKPIAGKRMSVYYNSALTPLKDKAVSCVVYSFIDYQWHAEDLKMVAAGKNTWKATFVPNIKCAFVAFKFLSDGIVDNNSNKAYGTVLKNPLDTLQDMPGAYAAWGLSRSPRYRYSLSNYIANGKGISDTLTHYWLEKEISRGDTTAKSKLAYPYASALFKAYGPSKTKQVEAIIKYLIRPTASEANMVDAWLILANVLKQQDRADSLNQAVISHFPNGKMDKINLYEKMMHAKQADQYQCAKDFFDKYPYKTADPKFDEFYSIDYNRVFLILVLSKIGFNDFKSIDEYLDQLSFAATVNIYYKTIEVTHSRKTMSDDFLYPYSEKLVKHMEYFKQHQPVEYHQLSPSEWQKEYNDKFDAGVYRPMAFTHIEICKNTGRFDEALHYAIIAEDKQQFKKAALNDAYVFLLQKKGDNKQLNMALLKSTYENQASVAIINLLKQNYIADHKSEAGFEDYLKSLKKPESQINENNMKMLNLPMVDWTMQSMDKTTVSLAGLKGKIVVMDFWATWCVPCKAALPGMKLAVEKYKNDPNVVFYFVDTEEIKSGYQEEVKKYIEDNHFPFNILFDNKTNGIRQNDEVFSRISKQYKVSGIPLKMVIDAEGKLQFLVVGYKGSPSGLADEISGMIETVKAKAKGN